MVRRSWSAVRGSEYGPGEYPTTPPSHRSPTSRLTPAGTSLAPAPPQIKAVSVTDDSAQPAIEQMPCQVVRGIFTRFCAPDLREVRRVRAFCQHVRAG